VKQNAVSAVGRRFKIYGDDVKNLWAIPIEKRPKKQGEKLSDRAIYLGNLNHS